VNRSDDRGTAVKKPGTPTQEIFATEGTRVGNCKHLRGGLLIECKSYMKHTVRKTLKLGASGCQNGVLENLKKKEKIWGAKNKVTTVVG
jgi:hypothetical protein